MQVYRFGMSLMLRLLYLHLSARCKLARSYESKLSGLCPLPRRDDRQRDVVPPLRAKVNVVQAREDFLWPVDVGVVAEDAAACKTQNVSK